MPLKNFTFRPGVNRENTAYSNEGGWYDADKVRFRNGSPESIGGWQKYVNATYLGTARALFNWLTLATENLLAIGTNLKLYIERGQALYDTTPLRLTGNQLNPLTTTINTPNVVVAYPSHGAFDGDFVTLSGASAVGGFTTGQLNTEHQIQYIDANSFRIVLGTNASSSVASAGGTVTFAFQINTGPSAALSGNGWGAGPWGSGGWGAAAATSVTLSRMRLWALESFGEILLALPRGGSLYFWNPGTMALGDRAVALSTLATTDAPLLAGWMLGSQTDRHLLLFGTNDTGSTEYDPLLVRWCSQEDLSQWTPSITNTAGSFRLEAGSYIVTAKRSRQEILAWTNSALYSITFIGAPEVFGRQQLADNITITAPNAAIFANGVMFWMGVDKFYTYTGRVETLPCSLQDFVFSDFNRSQADQVFAASNESFSEVTWFYCTAESTTIDRYVTFNYKDNVWYGGTMHRSAWIDASLKQYPLAAANGVLYYHELGVDDGSVSPAAPINSYIESSPVDLADGHRFMFATRVLPDLSFNRSVAASPAVTFTFKTSNAPGAALNTNGTSAAGATSTALVPIEQYTPVGYLRLRGRQFVVRVENTTEGTAWRLGGVRLDLREDGRR